MADIRALTRTVAPDPLLTLAEAKDHLRVDHTDEDVYITALVAAVSSSLDGTSGEYGHAIGAQRWQVAAYGPDASGRVYLPVGPVLSLVSIRYWPDGGGAQVTATLADFDLVSADSRAWVKAGAGGWPALADRIDAVEIVWQAGYSPVPDDVKSAARLMLGDFYANREGQQGAALATNAALDRLINLRKRWWLS